MKAIILKQPGGAEQLQLSETEKPVPKTDELLIRVEAAAVNRTDIVNRKRKSGYMNHPILGVEVAGVVEKTVQGSGIAEGTRVMGLVNGGGYAQYAVMPMNRAMTIPENLSFEEAAAIPEVFLTAYQTLFWLGRLQQDERVLIHAGGSGVGTAAIQLAKQLRQAHVITTAGTQAKLAYAEQLGADHCINYKTENFAEIVANVTDDQGVDLILDFVGATHWQPNLNSIRVDGRWVLIGVLGGSVVEKVDLMTLMAKRIQLTGTLLTPRSDDYKAELTHAFIDETDDLFAGGQLKPVIDRIFRLEDIQQAHEHMEQNKNIGKIILKINE